MESHVRARVRGGVKDRKKERLGKSKEKKRCCSVDRAMGPPHVF